MPSFSSHSQSDDSEREDHAMAAQISALSEQVKHHTCIMHCMYEYRHFFEWPCLHSLIQYLFPFPLQNQQLEAQLRDMEQERERLREMLSGEKKATAGEMAYTPPGLPSKVNTLLPYALHVYY